MQTQSSAREFQTQAETAQAKLRTSETSWAAQKEILDKQISELSTKQQELVEQNNLLHQHLETVSSQAARIRQAADASVSEAAETGSDPALAELRTVVSYLRKEKEIADLQIEINQQEIARLKADGERLARDLDEQKALLAEERTRATNSLASAQQQAELVERINQLNILRESNATLRSDAQAQRKRVAQLETQVQALTTELEPLKTEAREVKAELESRLQQISQLEKENTRWKERSQQILSKYDRADPEEVQKLKDEIESLRTANAELETKSDGYRTNLAAFKGQYESLTLKTRQNFSNLNASIASHKEEIKSLTAQRDALQSQLAEAQAASSTSSGAAQELERLKARIQAVVSEKQALEAAHAAEKKALEERLSAQQVSAGSDAELVALRAERDGLLAEKAAWSAATGSDDEKAAKIAELEAEKAQISESVAKFKTDAQAMFSQNKRLQDGNKALNAEVAALKAEKTSLEEQLKTAQASSGSGEPSAEVEALRAKVSDLEQRLAQQPPAPSGGADLASIEKALAEAEAKFKADHDVALQTAAENARQESSLKIQAQLGQIKKLNQRVKQLSDELRKHSLDVPKAEPMPPPTPLATASASPTAATPGTPLAVKTQVPATPGPSTSTPTAAGQAATALPNRKPSLPAPPLSAGLPPTPVAASGTTATRGRGAPRGRGRGGVPRSGGPGAAAAAAASAAAASGSTSAGPSSGPATGTKRPREEGEQVADSLTKRMRGGGPVPIQRNRPLPQT
ncbi:hypothetical protein AURDEDRAFT_153559 [Auricularia subglabra TFB-10046 SS5]|nr:hypothetical protein AURDEDRAFT_153559 [Auricularia subglabra TFB-10046 SS5]